MRVGDVETGGWFKHGEGRFIKTPVFQVGTTYYQAVNLDTGLYAFEASMGNRDKGLGDVEVELLSKS